MVLLIAKLHKLYNKLENHHHHDQKPEALSGSLHAFRADVSSSISQVAVNFRAGLGFFSLSWVEECFKLLPMINKAFAKLVVDIDYPMSRWKSNFIEEYLNYSLEMLDLFNSISSSLSHLGHFRLLVSHALGLVECSPSSAIEKLKGIEFKSGSSFKGFKDKANLLEEEEEEEEKERSFFEEELVIHEAFLEVKSIGFWVCSVVLGALSGDAKVYLEMRKDAAFFPISSLINLDSGLIMEKGVVLKEVKELIDAVSCLVSALDDGKDGSGIAKEMNRRLEEFEKMVDGLGKEVNGLFSEVLAGRNQLINGLRHNVE